MSRRAAAATALGIVCLAIATLAGRVVLPAATPDTVLAKGFGTAFGDSDTSWSTTPPNVWLSSLSTPAPAAVRPVNVGDMITITGKGGAPVGIEVTAIDYVDAGPLGFPGFRVQLVTGHEPYASGAKPVRFLFAVGPADHGPNFQVPAGRAANGGRVL
jgi:hypothetical protein